MSPESRSEYFKERRKSWKTFSVLLPAEQIDALTEKLKGEGKTKADWLRERIFEELGKTE